MQHPFFATVDWAKMLRRQVPVPFKPRIAGADDTANFDKEFTQMPAVLTPISASALTELRSKAEEAGVDGGGGNGGNGKTVEDALQLKGFTFIGDSPLLPPSIDNDHRLQ